MSQSFMTKGEEEMPQKGRGRKGKQSTPPSSSQLVIKETGDVPAEEVVPDQPARRLRSMVTWGTKSLRISDGNNQNNPKEGENPRRRRGKRSRNLQASQLELQ